MGDELNAFYRGAIKFVPPLLAVMFLFGWIEASIDMERSDNVYIVRFKEKSDPELRIPLRTFDRGLLMRNVVASRVEFYKWENIIGLEKAAERKSESLFCFFTTWMCNREMPATPN